MIDKKKTRLHFGVVLFLHAENINATQLLYTEWIVKQKVSFHTQPKHTYTLRTFAMYIVTSRLACKYKSAQQLL